jgi:hypothetical protein
LVAEKVLVLGDLLVEKLQLEDYRNLRIETHSAGADSVSDSRIVVLVEELGIVDVFVVWDL